MATETKNNILPSTEKTQDETRVELIFKLKDSTKKLLCVLEDIQSKVHSKNTVIDDLPNLSAIIKPLSLKNDNLQPSVTNIIGSFALRNLEAHTKFLGEINIKDKDDDCSVFKRLTRQCNCLNHSQYNDFIIHFNESTKYFTSTMGEVIKNVRILKNFLYIGGLYTKNALRFLNEGLSDNNEFSERVEIAVACSHADVCNVFEHFSIVMFCLLWPCKYVHYGDSETQDLASLFLLKLAKIEEGRRYLNYTSKITIDLKKLLRKNSNHLCYETLDNLNSTLNFLNPPLNQFINVTYYCKAGEGVGKRTLNALVHYRIYMTLEEIFTHLDVLHNMSDHDSGKVELIQQLPNVLSLFKHLIMEQDNKEMNIVITNILNKLVTSKPLITEEPQMPKATVVTDISTEPIEMKNAMNQAPMKKTVKSKLCIGASPKCHKISKRTLDGGWEAFRVIDRRSREQSTRTIRSQQAFDSSKKVNRSRTGRFESSKKIVRTSAGILESGTTYKKESQKLKTKAGDSDADTFKTIDRISQESPSKTFKSQEAFDSSYKIKRSRAERVDPSIEVITTIDELGDSKTKSKKEPQVLKTTVGGSDADTFKSIRRRSREFPNKMFQSLHIVVSNYKIKRSRAERVDSFSEVLTTIEKKGQRKKTTDILSTSPSRIQQSIDSSKKIYRFREARLVPTRQFNKYNTRIGDPEATSKKGLQILRAKVGGSDADAVSVIDRRPRNPSYKTVKLKHVSIKFEEIKRCLAKRFSSNTQLRVNKINEGVGDPEATCIKEPQNLKAKGLNKGYVVIVPMEEKN